MGQSIPFVCQDWANAKAAYRLLSNDRVNEADILAGHFQSTRDRARAAEGLRARSPPGDVAAEELLTEENLAAPLEKFGHAGDGAAISDLADEICGWMSGLRESASTAFTSNSRRLNSTATAHVSELDNLALLRHKSRCEHIVFV